MESVEFHWQPGQFLWTIGAGPSITQWWQKIHFQDSLEEWNSSSFLFRKENKDNLEWRRYTPVNWSNGLYIHHELSGLKEYWRVLCNFVKELLLKLFASKATNHKQNFNFSFFKASLLNLWMCFSVPAFNFPHPDKCLWHSGAFSLVARRSNKQSNKKLAGAGNPPFSLWEIHLEIVDFLWLCWVCSKESNLRTQSPSWRLMNFDSLIELFNLMKFYLTSFGTTFSF